MISKNPNFGIFYVMKFMNKRMRKIKYLENQAWPNQMRLIMAQVPFIFLNMIIFVICIIFENFESEQVCVRTKYKDGKGFLKNRACLDVKNR